MIKITTFGNILLILIDLFGIFDNFSKKNWKNDENLPENI